jgi:hypothetical protein
VNSSSSAHVSLTRSLLIIVALWLCSAAISAQNTPTAQSTAPKQTSQERPSEQAREEFRLKMLQTRLPSKKGCFTAHYPEAKWKKVQCGVAPKTPNPVARGAHPNYVGAGSDYFIQVTGTISSATGSFDSVTGVTSEGGPRAGSPTIAHPDTYSLQLNANEFSTTVCGGAPGCVGWEQFLFSQSQCNPFPSACIFIEYWLLNHGSPCPSGAWIYYAGTPTTVPGCYMNTAFAPVAVQPLADLANLKLTGSASGGTDTVTLSTASGNIVATSQDNLLNLAQGWSGGEFNLVGDCCAFEAFFNAGSNLGVRLSAANGTTNVPTCNTSFSGATAETNNLNLTSSCSKVGGASPAIFFSESGGGPLPPGISWGDTHLTNFRGVHYDFQASGEFVLVQADPDFEVQTRQKPWNPPSVAVNTGVGTRMGPTRVAVCLSGLEVNGSPTQLDTGKELALAGDVTVSRRNNIYVISRPSGDIVQANLMGGYMDVSVTLGATNPGTVRGLLGGREDELVMRDRTQLKSSIPWDTWVRFADSWRVKEEDSLLCHAGYISPGMPQKQTYVEDLKPGERERARAICVRAGVKDPAFLDDCTLDVSVLGADSAADVFVYAPPTRKVIKPLPPRD